jgi:tetratricopeptide (TPR) repeat protein
MRFARIVVVVLGLAGSAGAQTPVSFADYRAAVAAYRHGDIDLAAGLLANRPAESIKRAARALLTDEDDWRVAGAMAMLHTELVLRGRSISGPEVSLNMNLGLEIVESPRLARVHGDRAQQQQIAEFQERWYALAASVFLASTDPAGADRFVTRGLGVFKKSARLRMLAGAVDELRAHNLSADLHDRSVIAAMRPSRARSNLLGAVSSYQAALAENPLLAEARLRLGRTLALLNRVEPAREALQAAAAAGDPVVTYLAQLFLGALSSYQRDYAAARQAFQAALELRPMCQTPYIALAFAERMSGHDAAVGELFERFGAWQSAPLEADPWWAYQNGGLDDDSLEWLRERVVE